MDFLALKLILTPTLIGSASLVGRRWGPTVSGWLVAIPFTSAPIVFFLALNQGVAFAAATVGGTLAGAISQAAFCLAYAWVALRYPWPPSVVAGSLGFVASTVVLQQLTLPAAPLFLAVALALGVAYRLMPPQARTAASSARSAPRWDIPARMTVATTFVLLLTGLAPTIGPRLTGLLAPFPLYATILAVFAHRLQGAGSAVKVLRGLILGLFAFAGFFFVLAMLIERVSLGWAFAAALGVALMFQAGALSILRRTVFGDAPQR